MYVTVLDKGVHFHLYLKNLHLNKNCQLHTENKLCAINSENPPTPLNEIHPPKKYK